MESHPARTTAMLNKPALDQLVERYHRREYVHPDPLEFLYRYPRLPDREIVGLLASALAYGRVSQILTSVEKVLGIMGSSPRTYLENQTPQGLRKDLKGFRHRFTDGDALSRLLAGARKAIREHGSLHSCFLDGLPHEGADILPAMDLFSRRILRLPDHLLPSPCGGSPCKRLCLYLRWMVRSDAVDPGGWTGVSTSQLIVPLDTHIARFGQTLGLTQRKSPSLAMALDITDAFRALCPDDPVKYDFALTRFGIRRGMDWSSMMKWVTQRGSTDARTAPE